jgi:hypothetical protein
MVGVGSQPPVSHRVAIGYLAIAMSAAAGSI